MRMLKSLILAGTALSLATAAAAQDTPPGAPGAPPTWSYSAKTGAGSSYEGYLDGAWSDEAATGVVSRVWFSIADGVLTETIYGLIHEAQIKQLRLAVVTEDGLAVEGENTTAATA